MCLQIFQPLEKPRLLFKLEIHYVLRANFISQFQHFKQGKESSLETHIVVLAIDKSNQVVHVAILFKEVKDSIGFSGMTNIPHNIADLFFDLRLPTCKQYL